MSRWLAYWFRPKTPTDLAIGRVLFYGIFFLYYLPHDFSAWANVSEAFWSPITPFRVLPLPVFSAEILTLLQIIWKTALLLSCVGLLTRYGTAVTFLLGFYLLALPQNFSKVYHYDAILVFIFGILAASRCGDALSIDAWWRGLRVAPSGEYRWPIRAIWLTITLIFFAAGVAKLRNSGLEWVTSENMAFILLRQQYSEQPLVNWGIWLAQSGWFYRPIAAVTLFLEIGYPLAMILPRWRWLFILGMAATQIGIRIVMGPVFNQFIICNLFWIPYALLLRRLAPSLLPQTDAAFAHD